ncbi:hypothetical protein RNI52_04325 [Labrys neptuniae]|uniref:hypothetical protein n=1 Tax=Labrys neptuniae TaxID=376174 RepID=UPI002891E39E|nr:hypothetical protein [Labrys neptuniae]MDT3376546.1 hypothetical protein [Labrys neptuniae]
MKWEQIWLRLTLGCDPTLGCTCLFWFVATFLLSPLLSFGDHASARIVLIYLGCSAACWFYALEATRRRAEVAAALLVPRLGRYAVEGLLLFAAAQIIVPSLIIGLARRSPIEGLVSCAIQISVIMGGLIALRMNPSNMGRLQGYGWLFFYIAIILLGLEEAMWGARIPHFFGWGVTVLTACLIAAAAWFYRPVLLPSKRDPSVAAEHKVDTVVRAIGYIFVNKRQFSKNNATVYSEITSVFGGDNSELNSISGSEALRCLLWKDLENGFRWSHVMKEFLQRLVVLGLIGGVLIGFQYLFGGGIKQPPNLIWLFLAMLNSTTLEQAKKIWNFNHHVSADRELAAMAPGFGAGYALKVRFLRAAISPSIQTLILDIASMNICVIVMSFVYKDIIKYDSIFSILVINATMVIYNSVRIRIMLKTLLGMWDPNKHEGAFLNFVSIPFVLLMMAALEMPGSFTAVMAGICMLAVLYITKTIRDDLRVYFNYPHPFLPRH